MSRQTEQARVRSEGAYELSGGDEINGTKELNEEKLDDPKLLTNMEERLDNLRKTTHGGDETELRESPAAGSQLEDNDDDASDEEKASGEDVSDDNDSPTPDDTDGVGDKEDGAKESEDKAEDGPSLPEAYLRSAVAYGWKNDDVIEFFKADPERALSVLGNIYMTRNKVSSDYAAFGRQKAQAKVEPPESAFKPVDTAKLKEQWGDEAGPLIDMIEAQNTAMQQLADRIPVKEAAREDPLGSRVEQNAVEQQIYEFFETDRMKPYDKVYGKLGMGQTWDDLTPGQRAHRYAVLDKADAIAGGMKLQGVERGLAEILDDAHMLVTQKYRDQIMVNNIKASAVKRSKGIVLKPSKGKKRVAPASTGVTKRVELEQTVQERLNKVFG